MMEDSNSELEKFRKQWREEVTARSKGVKPTHDTRPEYSFLSNRTRSNAAQAAEILSPPSASSISKGGEKETANDFETEGYYDINDRDESRRLGTNTVGIHSSNNKAQEPISALQHYETAVERESQGNLGDSLSHYRKAYRVVILPKHKSKRALLTRISA